MMTKLTHRPSVLNSSRRVEHATHRPTRAEIDTWRRALDKVGELSSDDLISTIDVERSSRRLQDFLEGPLIDSADDYGFDDNSTIMVLDNYASFSREYHSLSLAPEPPYGDNASVLPLPNSELVEIRGNVKWYDPAKGYGFIASDGDRTDVLLHCTCLRASGFQTVHEGSRIHCLAMRRPRGLMAFQLLSVEDQPRPAPSNSPAAAGEPDVRAESEWETAYVKWFNRVRGFGFLTTGAGNLDIFVNTQALRKCGLTALRPGQAVSVRWGMGSKGRMAADIRPVR